MAGLLSADKRVIVLLISVAFSYIAAICVVIGLCTNYWIEIKNRGLFREETFAHFGLQRICWTASDRCTNSGDDYDRTETVPAVQGLLITGGFVCVLACLLGLKNFFLDRLGLNSLGRNRFGCFLPIFSFIASAVMVLAAVLIMVSVIIYGVKVEIRTEYLNVGHVKWLGYSFGLVVTASILLFISAALQAWTACIGASQRFNM